MSQQHATPLPEPRKPKLLDQVRHRCRLRHLALHGADVRRLDSAVHPVSKGKKGHSTFPKK